ncbi:MAG: alpha/beta hydrolase [Oscillospiraceae bacterium]|nr:alpha/beta hydrolase [Oscillospiraceae bacterium]
MALSKPMRFVIAALTRNAAKVNIKKEYQLVRNFTRAAHLPLLKPAYRPWNHVIRCGNHEVPVRIFSPSGTSGGLLIFFHGGGWVSGDIDSYSDVCVLMTRMIQYTVISVDYRLAPEHPFPAGLHDCYTAVQTVFQKVADFGFTASDVTLIGDSAGGNLAAAVSLMTRDRGAILPARQILLYPSLWYDHNPQTSPFESIRSNGQDNMLTAQRVEDYINLYKSSDQDLHNPYFAPLLAKDFSCQPATLILSAEYDPLRDEGEEYGRRLAEAGGKVRIRRIRDCMHGFFSLIGMPAPVKAAYQYINEFLSIR